MNGADKVRAGEGEMMNGVEKLRAGEEDPKWDEKGSVTQNYNSFGVVNDPNSLTDSLRAPPSVSDDPNDSGSDLEEDEVSTVPAENRCDCMGFSFGFSGECCIELVVGLCLGFWAYWCCNSFGCFMGSNIYVKNIDDSVSDEELKSQFVQINKENRKQLPYQITGMVKPSKLLTCFQWGALMVAGLCRPIEELDNLPTEEKALLNSLQTGNRLIAAGYVLYSSATILCITFGSGTHAFTLDRSTGDFILTNPNIKIPPRGQIYSVNDARYFDWPEGLRKYIDTVRQGKGRYPKKYSARYICSLVADLHRTLLYGGVAMNPRDHLRLVYEANPLSFIVEQAGGTGSDWKSRILSLQPVKLHQRLPLFLGSLEDMEELESYGDVQQKVNPGYEV
ncbi:hypothetical protein RYX36_026718 [Vicia faba]